MKLSQERLSLILAFSSLLLISPPVAIAQVTTADLIGTIKDSSGAVVPGVTVALTNEATGVSRSTTTGGAGTYIFTSLQPGRYRLTAELPGFRKVERTGVELQVNQRAQIDLDLELGLVSESLLIEGKAPLLETQSSVLGSVIEEKQVQELPLNGRNFVQLATLSAGVSGAGSGMRGTIMSGTRPDDLRPGTELFANGNRESSNNYLYDGIDNNTRLTLVIVVRPNVEAIKEFKVQTNLFSAEQGRNPGAQVNVVTKSGGNKIHGAIYEFVRNDRFDANNFFAERAGQPKPPFKQNQFGGAIGGPIVTNKTFYFADYDGFHQQLGRVFVNTVPTLKMRQGDFSEVPGTIYDPLTTVVLPGGAISRQPFPGNVIPQNRWDPVTAKLMNAYPLPTSAALANNLVTSPDAHAGLESVRRAHRSHAQRSEQLPCPLFLVKDVDDQPVHVRCCPAARRVETCRPRQRGHLRGSFRAARGARRLRLGACVFIPPGSGFARRLQPLQSRFHASRRRQLAINSANSSACPTRTSRIDRMASRSSARRAIRASVRAARCRSSGTRRRFNT